MKYSNRLASLTVCAVDWSGTVWVADHRHLRRVGADCGTREAARRRHRGGVRKGVSYDCFRKGKWTLILSAVEHNAENTLRRVRLILAN